MKSELHWLSAGALVAVGILVGFIQIVALPLTLIGAVWAAALVVERRPGAWMLLAGAGGAATLLYAIGFAGGGLCPYSSLTFPQEDGSVVCGPPDELTIFGASALVTIAGLALALRQRRKRGRREGSLHAGGEEPEQN